ncbi:hypothetical protein ACFP2T_43370 [Plantactinospora solaniradicis]|uniref:Uncharacterized protein n=1 Tax=Plantactinospora solaniradicis TaxID=1723736 RepID=A0ABW1KMC1_9ACTN
MAKGKRPSYGFTIRTSDDHGTVSFLAEICVVNPDGTFYRPNSDGLGDSVHHGYADLCISAYAEMNTTSVYMPRIYFQPFRLEKIDVARAMANTLSRADRGLKKVQQDHGYLEDHDFPGWLMRYGDILGIRKYFVRNTRQARGMSGQQYGQTNGPGLQFWFGERRREISEGYVLD